MLMDPVAIDMVNNVWIIVFRLSLVVQDFVQQAYHVLPLQNGLLYKGDETSHLRSFEMVCVPSKPLSLKTFATHFVKLLRLKNKPWMQNGRV